MSLAPSCKKHNTLMHPLIVTKGDDITIPGNVIIYDLWVCDDCEKEIEQAQGVMGQQTERLQ